MSTRDSSNQSEKAQPKQSFIEKFRDSMLGKGLDLVLFNPTMQGKFAQGATEIVNALYAGGESNAYSPYTAENAAHRAQFQAKDNAKEMDR